MTFACGRGTCTDEWGTEDERKLLCQLVPKLFISEDMSDLKIKSILLLIASLKLVRRVSSSSGSY